MKKEARILEYRGKELRTVSDINGASEALFNDLLSGNVTVREANKIQKEITSRIKEIKNRLKTVRSGLNTLQQLHSIEDLAKQMNILKSAHPQR